MVKNPDGPNGSNHSLFFQGASERINQLGIGIQSMEEKLTPGRYQVELTRKDGGVLTTPESLTLRPGRLQVNNRQPDYEGSRVRSGGTFLLTGENLYAGDLKVELVVSLGKVTKLMVADAGKYGETARIKPGPLAANEIHHLDDHLSSCSIQEPLLLPRDQKNYVSVNSVAPETRLKLVSVRDPARTYFAESELRHVTQLRESAFVRFAGGIPAGRYRVSLQVVDEAGEVKHEGPPYWRLVELK